jgi:hypothetical protein
MFNPTHKIVTEANKTRTNNVGHCYKAGTLVEWVKATKTHIQVVNANGSVQFVLITDLEAL